MLYKCGKNGRVNFWGGFYFILVFYILGAFFRTIFPFIYEMTDPTRCNAPCWQSIILYPTSTRGIIVKYSPVFCYIT